MRALQFVVVPVLVVAAAVGSVIASCEPGCTSDGDCFASGVCVAGVCLNRTVRPDLAASDDLKAPADDLKASSDLAARDLAGVVVDGGASDGDMR